MVLYRDYNYPSAAQYLPTTIKIQGMLSFDYTYHYTPNNHQLALFSSSLVFKWSLLLRRIFVIIH